jgi:anti-anti-sigma factor
LGTLDWIASLFLRHVIGDLLLPGVEVVIDLSEVDSIDSVGISAIVSSVRRVRAASGRAEIRGASPEVRRNMQLAGVYQLLTHLPVANGDDAA